MITLQQTDATHPDFIKLVNLLNEDLAIRNGDDHAFYMQFNGLSTIHHVVLAYDEGKVVGCGAMKELEPFVFEVKRMYVLEDYRGKGVATAILSAIENWANKMGIRALVLETGVVHPEAMALYAKYGFVQTENYGQYKGVSSSICYRKEINIHSYES